MQLRGMTASYRLPITLLKQTHWVKQPVTF